MSKTPTAIYYHQHEKKKEKEQTLNYFIQLNYDIKWGLKYQLHALFAMKIVKLLVNDKIIALCHTRKHYFKCYKEQKRKTSLSGFTPTCPYGA